MADVGVGVSSGPTLTVASYNMRKAIGTDRRRRPDRVLDVLHEIDADVVALQEADKRFGGRGAAVPHELIDDHGTYKPVPLQVRNRRMLDRLPKAGREHAERILKINGRSIGWHGNALLVKRHIGVLDVGVIELPTLEPRGAVMAELLINEHGTWKPVELGVRNRRMLDRLPSAGRAHAERILRINGRSIGWHGNALLVKRHIGVLDVAIVDLPTLEPRGAVMAELLFGDWPVRVVGMHLDLSGLWRRRQLRAILDAVAARPQKMPTVLMGDTNEWRAASGCLQELNGGFRIAPTGASFHSRHPIACLDRIIVDNQLRIEAAGVHMSPSARRASDHLPVWARLSA